MIGLASEKQHYTEVQLWQFFLSNKKRETAMCSGMISYFCSALYAQGGANIGDIFSGCFVTTLTTSVKTFQTPDATGDDNPPPDFRV